MKARPPIRFRKLRIAWSAGCGILCLLLIVLWVRTRYATETISGPLPGSASFGLVARDSGVGLVVVPITPDEHRIWTAHTLPFMDKVPWSVDVALGFVEYRKTDETFSIRVPCWSLMVLCAVLSVAPWVAWSKRFSLRTLLIAITLAAVVLGAVVWVLE